MMTLPRRKALFFAAALMAFPVGLAPVLAVRAEAQQAAPVTVIAPDDALAQTKAGEIILIDIRTPGEWAQTGVAEGAIGLDMTRDDFVDQLVGLRRANPDTPLALICRTGNRSGHVAEVLSKQGFPGLADVSEGMVGGRNGPGWLKRGLPVYAGTDANVQERSRARLGQD